MECHKTTKLGPTKTSINSSPDHKRQNMNLEGNSFKLRSPPPCRKCDWHILIPVEYFIPLGCRIYGYLFPWTYYYIFLSLTGRELVTQIWVGQMNLSGLVIYSLLLLRIWTISRPWNGPTQTLQPQNFLQYEVINIFINCPTFLKLSKEQHGSIRMACTFWVEKLIADKKGKCHMVITIYIW